MVRVLYEEPAFSQFFIDHLLTRTLRIEEDLVDQLYNSSERRLARTPLLLANFDKGGMPETIIRKISQEKVAQVDWHNEASQLMLNINDALARTTDEKSRAVVIRRLRRALNEVVPSAN